MTGFFRHPEVLDSLRREVLRLLDERGRDRELRAWSVGCDAGEQAYSLAMVLLEAVGGPAAMPRLRVFASEVRPGSFERAREARYPEEIEPSVGPDRLARFFERANGDHRVRRSVRERVVFTRHDLFADPPFARLDVVACPGILGDLDPDLRRALFARFHRALAPGGILAVGASEPVGEPERFQAVPGSQGLHRRCDAPEDGAAREAVEEAERGRFGEADPIADAYRSSLVELEAYREELRESNAERARLSADLASLLASPEIAALVLDRGLAISRFSRNAEMLLELRSADHGRAFADVARRLGLDDLVDDARRAVDRSAPVEHEVRAASGRWFFTRVLAYRDAEDRVDGVVVTFVDVTRLKEAEEEMRRAKVYAESIVDTLHEPVLVLTSDLRVKSANRAYYDLFRVDAAETIGRLVYELGNGQWNVPQLRRLLEEILPRDERFDDYEVAHEFSRIGRRVIALNARRIEVLDLILLGLRDVSEQRWSEATTRERAAEFRQEDARKERFLATLGHELRNPLAALDSAMRIIERGVRDPSELHPMMSAHIRQLASLVNDLLEVTRITRGKITLRKARVDLSDVVHAAVQAVQSDVRSRRQGLVLSIPTDFHVHADETRFEQVVSNLLSNASKYTPERGRIEVKLRREGGEAVLTVVDEGRGLGREQLESIFEAFVQEDPTGGGLGIGLALVKSLVELHGGSVRADSEGRGRGSRFTVRIPVGTVDEVTEPEESDEDERLPWTARVLVVDDERDSADLLALLLSSNGAETVCAYSGEECLEKVRTWRPEVALIDIGLPDMTGFEVAERIRGEEGDERILLCAVTGYGDAGTERKARRAGFDARLLKPVDHDKLQEILRRHRGP